MHKSCPAQIKAAGADDGLLEGQFRAIVSVFGNKDSYGDIIVPGAFTDTLAEWQAKGDPLPVYWSHQLSDPDMNIGYVVEATQTDKGLEVLGQLDLDSQKAAQVYRLMKGRRVTDFSFSYEVRDGGMVERDGETYMELRSLGLYEVGPTPVGANPATDLLAVKHAVDAIEAFASAPAYDAQLAALAAQLTDVLAALAVEAKHPATASESTSVKDEEPVAAKSEEPARCTSVETWGVLIQLTDMEHAS